MILLARAAALLGWRGALGTALGALLAAAPAYHAGVWTERAAGRERIGRAIAEHELQRMENENGKIAAAAAARARIGRADDDGRDGGGLPDDPFRRD